MEVLHTLNVQHGHPAVALGDEAAGDARDGFFDGNTRVHQRQRGAADGRLAGGAVGAEHLGHAADGVRELLNTGQHGQQGALGKSAVADLAAARAAGRTRLAHGIGREIIVVHIPLRGLQGNVVHDLRVPQAGQRDSRQHLRLTAGEHAGAVYAGQQAHFGGQRADLVDAAAVHALTLVQQPAAHHELLHLVHQFLNGRSAPLLGVFLLQLVADGEQPRVAHGLVVGVHGRLESVQIIPLHFLQQVVVQLHGLELDFGFADLSHDAVDEGDNLLDLGVAGLDGFQHGGFVHLVGAGLDHDDLFGAGGNGKLQVACFTLLFGGVHHQFAVHKAHEHARDGSFPGNVGDGKRNGRADHARDFGAAVLVHAHNGHHHRDVVPHVLGEQRTDGTVHNTARQHGLFAGTALAAHEAAGDAAHGIQLFFKVHRKGEEIDAVAGLVTHGDVAQHGGLAVAHQAAAVGKAAHLARLHNERAACQLGFKHFVPRERFFFGCKFECHCIPPVFSQDGRCFSNKASALPAGKPSIHC